MIIPVISLHRPWAEWVLLGIKPIETRTHQRFRNLVGKRIGIHAAEHWDSEWLDKARAYLNETQIAYTQKLKTVGGGGCIKGTVFVLEHRPLTEIDAPKALIECRTVQRYGLVLKDPAEWSIPFVTRGYQGIWNVEVG